MRHAFASLIALGCLGCLGPSTQTTPEEGRRILFIGNSHTSTHDVPGLLQALAAAAGPEPLVVASIVSSNMALIDHAAGFARGAIASNAPLAVVVLQQGWTPAGVCRDTLRLATAILASEAEKAGAKVGMYQVWTPANRANHLPGTIRSYELAADDVDGMLFPAAAAFRNVQQRDPSISLYLDGTHASQAGAYLVALVMYATIFERTPVGLPASVTAKSGVHINLLPAVAATLQEAAADVTTRGLGRSNGEDGPVIANPGTC